MKRNQPQIPAADVAIEQKADHPVPAESRQNDGGEGVIVTRGEADVGKAARKNAEDAVNANQSQRSNDPHL